MKSKFAPRKSRKGKSLFLTFLLLLSIPVFILGLLQDESFDIRNRAFDDIEVSDVNPCVISFPNVNPYSLEVDSTFRVQIDALSTTLGIKAISVIDENNNPLLSKTYEEDIPKRVSESFTFTPTSAKAYEIKGIMLDLNKKTYECVISSSYDVSGVRAVSNNSKPTFATLPKNSIPSQSIKTGDTYEYTLVAEDIDGDTINYSYSFTPGADWLKATIIEDGGNGKLTIKFKGSTTDAASYLANIFIHDGYSKHLASQSWVVSVSPKENDIPNVKIIEPLERTRISEQETLRVVWDALDDNHIVKFEMYLSSNPTNEKSWITIDKEIDYNTTFYDIDTSQFKDGTYRVILRAIDNQKPEAIGMDISEEIIISKGQTEGKEPDDSVVLDTPQVINFSPTSSDTVENNKPTIKASLIASKDSALNQESIKVLLDDKDITSEIKINKISEYEYTVIYLPEETLEQGVHKVDISFSDSSDKSVEKSWTFSISDGEEVDPDSFNIFGYYINKRVALIIAGGIALVVLAIFTPMIIFAVWKDDTQESKNINPTLPPSTPRDNNINDIQQYNTNTEVENLVTQSFQAPKPIENSNPDSLAQNEVSNIPEPEDDLSILLTEIDAAKKEDDSNS